MKIKSKANDCCIFLCYQQKNWKLESLKIFSINHDVTEIYVSLQIFLKMKTLHKTYLEKKKLFKFLKKKKCILSCQPNNSGNIQKCIVIKTKVKAGRNRWFSDTYQYIIHTICYFSANMRLNNTSNFQVCW